MDRVSGLIARAQHATALDDFGDDSFREGLDVLVASTDREGGLNEAGCNAFDGLVIDLLSWRLKIEQCYAEHPQIDDQEIVAPLFGLGLPRTGSTAFSILLGEDPDTRSIRNWEGMMPCPPPQAATQETDPRIEIARLRMEQRQRTYPRWKTMMPSSATTPVECQSFMGYDFKSLFFVAFAPMPTYQDWLLHKADLVPTYQYLKRVLKLLQWHCPPTRWRLKNPGHTLFIDALDKVFPDARFWQTHRGVEHVIPSAADMYHELMKGICPDLDRASLGPLLADIWDIGLRRLIDFRNAGNDHRFFDIEFNAFQRDPIGGIRALYAFLGETLSDTAIARMQQWRSNTPRDKHGVHIYDGADFGIDEAQLRERFRFYDERFNLRKST